MSQIPAIGLVVVKGGVAGLFSPSHVDLRLVDIDNIKAGDEKETLPMGIGFEKLVSDAGIQEYVTFDLEPWQDHPDFPMSDWQQEVAAGDTQLGYVDWVKARIEDLITEAREKTLLADSFFTEDELRLVDAIITRARNEMEGVDPLRLQVYISRVHKACPLDLIRLLNFAKCDFTHDIAGIWNNIDPQTGKLMNCFSPRCTRRDHA